MHDFLDAAISVIIIIMMFSILLLIIGMIKPSCVLKFISEEKRNKRKVLQIYGLIIIGFIFMSFPIKFAYNASSGPDDILITYLKQDDLDPEELQRKIDLGADVNYVNEQGQTALKVLIRNSHCNNYKELSNVLIDNGTDINAIDQSNRNILYGLLIDRSIVDREEKIKFLIDNGIDINNKDKSGNTLLIKVAEHKDQEMYELLLGVGADKSVENNKGITAEDIYRENNERERKKAERRVELETKKEREKAEKKIARQHEEVELRRERAELERERANEIPTVAIGMTSEQFKKTYWGELEDINRTTSALGVSEQWVYGNGNYAYFENGILRTIQN